MAAQGSPGVAPLASTMGRVVTAQRLPYVRGLLAQLNDDDDLKLQLHSSQCTPGSRGWSQLASCHRQHLHGMGSCCLQTNIASHHCLPPLLSSCGGSGSGWGCTFLACTSYVPQALLLLLSSYISYPILLLY